MEKAKVWVACDGTYFPEDCKQACIEYEAGLTLYGEIKQLVKDKLSNSTDPSYNSDDFVNFLQDNRDELNKIYIKYYNDRKEQ